MFFGSDENIPLRHLECAVENNIDHIISIDGDDILSSTKATKNIIEKFKDIEICVFGTGIHDPQSEKEFNLEKIRKIMEVNYFGTMNSINSVYNYYKDKNIEFYNSFILLMYLSH